MEGLKVLSSDLTPIIKKYLKMTVKEIFIEDIVASLFNKRIDFKTIKTISSIIDILIEFSFIVIIFFLILIIINFSSII